MDCGDGDDVCTSVYLLIMSALAGNFPCYPSSSSQQSGGGARY